MGGVQRSTLQGRFGRLNDLAGGGDPWSGLRRQFKLKLLYQEPLVAIGFCVAAEDQHAPIGSREVNVKHLDGCEFLEDCPGGKPACQRPEPSPQGDVQAIG
jgi:hypothetical protein